MGLTACPRSSLALDNKNFGLLLLKVFKCIIKCKASTPHFRAEAKTCPFNDAYLCDFLYFISWSISRLNIGAMFNRAHLPNPFSSSGPSTGPSQDRYQSYGGEAFPYQYGASRAGLVFFVPIYVPLADSNGFQRVC